MLIAGSLAELGATTPQARVDIVSTLTLLVGLLCLIASALRLGLISSLDLEARSSSAIWRVSRSASSSASFRR